MACFFAGTLWVSGLAMAVVIFLILSYEARDDGSNDMAVHFLFAGGCGGGGGGGDGVLIFVLLLLLTHARAALFSWLCSALLCSVLCYI